YQFWLNVADDDAEKYIKIFTMLDKETIDDAIEEHRQDPGRRVLQNLLAREITIMIHGEAEYDNAVAASKMLFGNSTSEALRKLDEKTFLAVFSGVPTFDIPASELPCNILDFLAVKTQIFPSKGEARKMTVGNGVSINKDKVTDVEYEISEKDIIDGKYILAQKGKKNYFIINVI
ncbi:MAG: tyrosine--tRNA ligase, partial [Bacteroidales bacterium]|nr:tyrosine--tRNA ligase [Bacteroidales bacterium]